MAGFGSSYFGAAASCYITVVSAALFSVYETSCYITVVSAASFSSTFGISPYPVITQFAIYYICYSDKDLSYYLIEYKFFNNGTNVYSVISTCLLLTAGEYVLIISNILSNNVFLSIDG